MEKQPTNSQADKSIRVLLGLIFCVPSALFSGYVFSVLWGWFVVPLGVISIGIWHAIGLLMIVAFFKRYEQDGEELAQGVVDNFFKSWLLLIFGWIAHGMAAI